jgi:hypothetical protein
MRRRNVRRPLSLASNTRMRLMFGTSDSRERVLSLLALIPAFAGRITH